MGMSSELSIQDTVGRLDWANPYKRVEVPGIEDTIDYYIPNSLNTVYKINGNNPFTSFGVDGYTAVYMMSSFRDLISDFIPVVEQSSVGWHSFSEAQWDGFTDTAWSLFQE